LSFDYGIDTKVSLSPSVFLRISGELNLSTNLIPLIYDVRDADLFFREVSHDVSGVRNLLLFGFGVGKLF